MDPTTLENMRLRLENENLHTKLENLTSEHAELMREHIDLLNDMASLMMLVKNEKLPLSSLTDFAQHAAEGVNKIYERSFG